MHLILESKLNLNPFILFYFFLARGYGLGLSFQMLGIIFLLFSYEKMPQKQSLVFLFLATISGMLSVLSNFTFLNFYRPLLVLVFWLLLSNTSAFELKKRPVYILTILSINTLNTLFVVLVLQRVIKLKNNGAFYFGGNINFIHDTVLSLVRMLTNCSPKIAKLISAGLIGLFCIFMILALISIKKNKKITLFPLFTAMLVGAITLPILQHYLVEALFPIERGALYLVPLYMVALLYAFEFIYKITKNETEKKSIIALLSLTGIIMCTHYSINYNVQTIINTAREIHDKEVVNLINQDRNLHYPNQMINVGNSWQLEPTLNHYRYINNYDWMHPITRNRIDPLMNNYIYAFESDLKDIPIDNPSIISTFSDTKTVLIRVK